MLKVHIFLLVFFFSISQDVLNSDNVDAVAKKYKIDPNILYGLISKVSGGGDKLDFNGTQDCDPNCDPDYDYCDQCFGVMRVPLDRSDTSAPPDSQQAIEDGVIWLNEIANCVCESRTKSDGFNIKINSKDANKISKYTCKF